ncbi:ATP-binding protein [Nocardiopsis sp. YSL2]|uniref:ATP-binding protein n=1 Tax=Nocardiopsis sp. YSL2 TaxID=2939492 RepID=UPI0026F449FC|nr:ATP-binding protein [Nocardiopsis sp. YSL2]
MFIVPQPRPPAHTAAPAFEGRRWPCRLYPGDLSHTSRFRADLRRDLSELAGLVIDTADDLVLCASELYANAVDHSRSGEPDGHVIRTLTMPTADRLRVGVIDDGHRTNSPHPPMLPEIPRTAPLDGEWAERGRGLLLIDHLAAAWGSRAVVGFPFCEGLGTFLWAEFAHTDATVKAVS